MMIRMTFSLLLISLLSMLYAQVYEIPDSSAVTGVGSVFEIKRSEFLNITVESSKTVFAYVQSTNQQIIINVAKPGPEDLTTTLTIKNLTPETSYNLIRNGVSEVIYPDDSGMYQCEVNLTNPQKIMICTR